MKIGIAQINTTVGDLAGNRQQILEAYAALVRDGAELVLFPELVVCGYPPRDLLFKRRFVDDTNASLEVIAEAIGDVPAVIGTVGHHTAAGGRPFTNTAAWCENGKVVATGQKSLLPTYDVFDEERYFEPGPGPLIHEWKGLRIGITVCEDIWVHPNVQTSRRYCTDPVATLAEAGVDLLLNLSASPWHAGKNEAREPLVQSAADRCKCPAVYCNAVGGNDELIFDGGSLVAHPEKGLIAGLAAFRTDLRVVDTAQASSSAISPHFNPCKFTALHDALVLGLRDYAYKSGFRKALIGLSGGIDSAVVAALAAEAFGPENVIGVSLPSAISSQHSRDDARVLAENLGITFHTLPIASIVEAAEAALKPLFEGQTADVTEENIQARSRGLLLMALSNKFGALLLSTGNKSEVSVGYCTLYGDMAGGLSVISDVPKMQVYALARHINREREIIPVSTIEKPPSAELRPDQKDEDSLPPYPVLDAILKLYVEEGRSSVEIIEAGYDAAVVREIIRKVDLNEYKRKQGAPGLKTTPLAFGVGRRIPIVQKYVS